jgi:hypothetical protein
LILNGNQQNQTYEYGLETTHQLPEGVHNMIMHNVFFNSHLFCNR